MATLKSNSRPEIKRSSQDKYHQVQEKIILGDIEGLFKLLATWTAVYTDNTAAYDVPSFSVASATKGSTPAEVMRFAAHLVVFFLHNMPAATPNINVECEVLLTAYIRHLIKSKKVFVHVKSTHLYFYVGSIGSSVHCFFGSRNSRIGLCKFS